MLLMTGGFEAAAQKSDTTNKSGDTANKIPIHILRSNRLIHNKTDSGDYDRFIDSVIMQQGTDTLYCDSAYQNETSKNFEAFGNVKIIQTDGTRGASDYLRYTAKTKLAFMQGNVSLTDGKNNLACHELTYDLGTKTGVYSHGGTLHNDSTTVTSNSGVYNVKSKISRFTGHVVITDPEYNIRSEDLDYNTESKITRFYAKSTVTRDSGRSILQTSNGNYDGKNGIAHFVGWSSIWSDGQYIEADTLNYSKVTGYGLAIGHVISIDTAHHSTMYCGHAEYFKRPRILWATIKPVLEQVNGKDTLYIRADTFYSAPMAKVEVQQEFNGVQFIAWNADGGILSKKENLKNILPDLPWSLRKWDYYKYEWADAVPSIWIPADDKNIIRFATPVLVDTLAPLGSFTNPWTKIPAWNEDGGLLSNAENLNGILPALPASAPRHDYYNDEWPMPTISMPVEPNYKNNIGFGTPAILDTLRPKEDTVMAPVRDTGIAKAATKIRKTTKPPKATNKPAKIYPKQTNEKADVSEKQTVFKWEMPKDAHNKQNNNIVTPGMAMIDTTDADSSAPLFFIGYHHVLIFSDSLQGKCDSICYTRSDSTIRMMYDPIAWSHKSQITGDTILMMLDSNQLRSMYVPNNALAVSQSGPEKAHLYDQVQGKTLTSYFRNNAVDSMIVVPDAESIYYSKDEAGAYMGVDQSKSELMRIFFVNQEIKKIKFEKDVHHTLTPMDKADLPAMKLSRFKWLIELRPKSKEELFR